MMEVQVLKNNNKGVLLYCGLLVCLISTVMLLGLFLIGRDIIADVYYKPQQVQLSFGETSDQIIVKWITRSNVTESVVEYGSTADLSNRAVEYNLTALKGKDNSITEYIHIVGLTDLKPATRYYYRVGGERFWSGIFHFNTVFSNRDDADVKFAIFGDDDAIPNSSMKEEVLNGFYDAILHIGNFIYGRFSQSEYDSLSAYVPYMCSPGKAEYHSNFSYHKNYLKNMDGFNGKKEMFYSFNVGPVHFISINTDAYFYNDNFTDDDEESKRQYNWLLNDLKEANTETNRGQQPWIITFGYTPMYCSDNNYEYCHNSTANFVKNGNPLLKVPGLEDLFYLYGVDVEIYAESDSYQRFFPVYSNKRCDGQGSSRPYEHPNAPIHITAGSTCTKHKEQVPLDLKQSDLTAYQSSDCGYARLSVVNTTHLHIEWVSLDRAGQVIDTVTVVKDKHGQGLYDCHRNKEYFVLH